MMHLETGGVVPSSTTLVAAGVWAWRRDPENVLSEGRGEGPTTLANGNDTWEHGAVFGGLLVVGSILGLCSSQLT